MNVDAFSPDYLTASARFRKAAQSAGCRLESFSIPVARPVGDVLTIDVASLGRKDSSSAVVVSSGLHGVEGFFGSALQIALLRSLAQDPSPPTGVKLIFIHALNPFGFNSLRRTDEDNVDLNRNFLLHGEQYSGAPEGYADLERRLNLSGPPRPLDLFFAKLAYLMISMGPGPFRESLAGGQYISERGMFFGGRRPSPTRLILQENLAEWVGQAARIIHLDLHSGLGRWATYKLIVDHPIDSPRFKWLRQQFAGDRVEPSESVNGSTYHMRGGLGSWCQEILAGRMYDLATAEFGTYPGPVVLWALRAENHCHWHREPSSFRYRLRKRILKEVFAPASSRWRRRVLDQGLSLVLRAIEVCHKTTLEQRT